MFDKLNKITIKGRCFSDGIDLELNKRINVLFGRNGSGKSTIAAAFKSLKGESETSDLMVSCNVSLDTSKDNIAVFDEKFIDSSLKIDRDGVQCIVMLGEQIDVMQRIESLERRKNAVLSYQTKNDEKKSQLENKLNEESPFYWRSKIETKLKEGWSERQRRIKNKTIKSSVSEPIFNKVIHYEDLEGSSQTYQDEIEKGIISLTGMEQWGRINVCHPLPKNYDFEECRVLLESVVDYPELSDREKRIVELIKKQQLARNVMHDIPELQSRRIDMCPYCFREFSENQVLEYSVLAERILNDNVRAFGTKVANTIRSLDDYVKLYFQFDLDTLHCYGDIINNTCKELKSIRIKILRHFLQLRDILSKKQKNPYVQQHYDFDELKISLLPRFIELIKQLNVEIANYNARCETTAEIQNRLLALNLKCAALENVQFSKLYAICDKNYNACTQKGNKCERLLRMIEAKLDLVRGKLRNTKIALDEINKALAFIFLSPSRMTLEHKGDLYCLKVRGHDVLPSQISVGERNAVALAYFFTQLYEGIRAADRYRVDKLVIIDDPVTSFDYENRIGIMSFLRWQCLEIIDNSCHSKVLFLSHDIQSIFDFSKIPGDISLSTGNKEDRRFYVAQINNRAIEPLNVEKLNEYKAMLQSVMTYAKIKAPTTESAMGIGNQMRRVAEALSTFLYSCGIDELIRKKELIGNASEVMRNHFKNVMLRLVLNDQSHLKDKTRGLNLQDYTHSPEVVQKMARTFLLFLLETHPVHMKSMFSPDELSLIKTWESSIVSPFV